MIEILIVIGAFAAAGFAAAPLMLRKSAIEEMRLLIDEGTTSGLLSSGWAEDDFPEFFAGDWRGDGRQAYGSLLKALGGRKYGPSRKLLRRLMRIEDQRQAAKGHGGKGDEAYRARMLSAIEANKGMDGFESVLAAFLAKRYTERKHGDRG